MHLFEHPQSKVRKALVVLYADLHFSKGTKEFEHVLGNHLTENRRRLIKVYYDRRLNIDVPKDFDQSLDTIKSP